MSRRIIIIIMFCFTLLLCGCGSKAESKANNEMPSMFVIIEEGPYWEVLYHRYTKVMYVVSAGSYNHGTFTLLVNPDGSPMIYEEK